MLARMPAEASARHPIWADVPDERWNDWRWQLRHRVTTLQALEVLLELTPEERVGIQGRGEGFPFAITPYYASLMDCSAGGFDCPIRRQAIPLAAEGLPVPGDWEDPLAEDEHSPVALISHRYPDRALFYVSHNCPMYCRHCTRARKVGDVASAPRPEALAQAYDYLRSAKIC